MTSYIMYGSTQNMKNKKTRSSNHLTNDLTILTFTVCKHAVVFTFVLRTQLSRVSVPSKPGTIRWTNSVVADQFEISVPRLCMYRVPAMEVLLDNICRNNDIIYYKLSDCLFVGL